MPDDSEEMGREKEVPFLVDTSSPADRPPALRFSGVTHRYGRHVALDGISLEVARGETGGRSRAHRPAPVPTSGTL
jgi:hypothetical protein